MRHTTVAVCVGSLAAALVAGCGGSSNNASTASVCQKLRADLPAAASAPAQNLHQQIAKLRTVASKLKSDTADAKDATLRQAGASAANQLDTALNQATGGSAAAARTALENALSAARQVQSQCPAV
jgi:endonuclease YncB( thermonuclease family)